MPKLLGLVEIKKPQWLHDFLEDQSLDIFTWRFYMPTFMEMAFDWSYVEIHKLISPIDEALGAVWQWETYITNYLETNFASIIKWLQLVEDLVRAVNQIVGDWLVNLNSIIDARVQAFIQPVLDLVGELYSRVEGVKGTLDIFIQDTLPQMAPKAYVDAAIEQVLSPWFLPFEVLGRFFRQIDDFFKDPLQWIYDRMEEFVERFW